MKKNQDCKERVYLSNSVFYLWYTLTVTCQRWMRLYFLKLYIKWICTWTPIKCFELRWVAIVCAFSLKISSDLQLDCHPHSMSLPHSSVKWSHWIEFIWKTTGLLLFFLKEIWIAKQCVYVWMILGETRAAWGLLTFVHTLQLLKSPIKKRMDNWVTTWKKSTLIELWQVTYISVATTHTSIDTCPSDLILICFASGFGLVYSKSRTRVCASIKVCKSLQVSYMDIWRPRSQRYRIVLDKSCSDR